MQMLYFPIIAAVSYFDIKTKTIPNILVFVGIVLGICSSQMDGVTGWLAGGLAMLFVALLALQLYGKTMLGGGDIKLVAMIGAFFGAKVALLTFVFAPVLGFFFGLMLNKKLAYAPYISLASFVALLIEGVL